MRVRPDEAVHALVRCRGLPSRVGLSCWESRATLRAGYHAGMRSWCHSVIGVLLACAAFGSALVGGCRAGGQKLEAVNSQLREENLELRDRLSALEQRNAELQQAVRATSREVAGLSEEVRAIVPRVTSISLDRLTGIAESDAGLVLRAYVEPIDGRGRFVQMTGEVTVKLLRVPAGEDEDAETVAAQVFGPSEVRDAYRSGFMGTHYTFEAPVTLPGEPSAGESWLVVATFVDGVTGDAHHAERAIEIAR